MSSHAQSCYGTSFPVSNRLIMSVNILHQFRWNKSFVTVRQIFRTVPVPAILSVRTNKDDSFFIRNLRKIRFHPDPCFSISTITVQQINPRTSLLADSLIRQYIHNFYILIHGCTSHQHRVYTCRLQHYGRQTPQKPQGNNSFFHLFIVYFF